MYNGINWLRFFQRASSELADSISLANEHPQLIVSDVIEVDVEKYGLVEHIYVYNSIGDVLLKEEAVSDLICRLEVGHLPSGIYNLAVVTRKGGLKARRFLKE